MRHGIHRQRPVGYDIAEICANGHLITQFAQTEPQNRKKFCDKCGAATITQCPKCTHTIQGFYYHPTDSRSLREPPAFCHNCGTAYPWTEQRLAVAKELVEESGTLTREENVQFQQSLDDLVRETPKTPRRSVGLKSSWRRLGRRSQLAHGISSSMCSAKSLRSNFWARKLCLNCARFLVKDRF